MMPALIAVMTFRDLGLGLGKIACDHLGATGPRLATFNHRAPDRRLELGDAGIGEKVVADRGQQAVLDDVARNLGIVGAMMTTAVMVAATAVLAVGMDGVRRPALGTEQQAGKQVDRVAAASLARFPQSNAYLMRPLFAIMRRMTAPGA